MLSKLLPSELYHMISSKFNLTSIYEVRIRRNMPICVNVSGSYRQLRDQRENKIIFADKRLIDYILLRATESSLYCYNNQLKSFYISAIGGLRIGVCGEAVVDDKGIIKTVKNISSLNIRIPHEVLNCSKSIMQYIMNDDIVNNCLIISPPCCGKTTFIRDIARIVGSSNRIVNTLIVDERFEICAENNGEMLLDVGMFADCLSGVSKEIAFSEGVKSLKPDLIICDELVSQNDIAGVKLAINSGVSVIASAHGEDLSSLRRKLYFKELINEQYFDYLIFLSGRNGPGTIDCVYNKDFRQVWG